jgi:hypothetical protein
VQNPTGNFEANDPTMQQCFKQEPVLKRFVPTNEEKLATFKEQLADTITDADLASMVSMVRSNKDLKAITKLLTSKYGTAAKNAGVKLPHLFGDNEMSIDKVSSERIEVEGPEQGENAGK